MRRFLCSLLLAIAYILYVDAAGVETAYGVNSSPDEYDKIDGAYLQNEANPSTSEMTTTTTNNSKAWFSWFRSKNKYINEPTILTATLSTPLTSTPVPLPSIEELNKGPPVSSKPRSTAHVSEEIDWQSLTSNKKADISLVPSYDPKKYELLLPDNISFQNNAIPTAGPSNKIEPLSPTVDAKTDFSPKASEPSLENHSLINTILTNNFNNDNQGFLDLPFPNGYDYEDGPPLTSQIQPHYNNGVVSIEALVPYSKRYGKSHPNTGGKVKDLINFFNSKAARTRKPLLPSEIVGPKKPAFKVTDEELTAVSEELFSKDANHLASYVKVNYQAKTSQYSKEDKAPGPLFEVKNQELWNLPIVKEFVALLDNYDEDVAVTEHVSPQEEIEENAFLDSIMNTTMMRSTMAFLQSKEIVSSDPKEQSDLLRQIWFNMYSRGKGKMGSSGFEHVFMNEKKKGKSMGFHNWIYYVTLEEKNKVNYLGYWMEVDLDSERRVLYPVFSLGGKQKPINSFFVGTSPEYEMSLYTLCFFTRVNKDCKVSANGKPMTILTFKIKSRSKIHVGSAFVKING